MFYGGRLLRHLSAKDPDIEEFISLRRLNRNIAIVIDSDRKSLHHKLNDTKRRIRDEFMQGPGLVWITYGREIENYITADILESAVKEVHKQAVALQATDRFDHALFYKKANGEIEKSVDKVAIARVVADQSPTLDRYDLRDHITKLADFIRHSSRH